MRALCVLALNPVVTGRWADAHYCLCCRRNGEPATSALRALACAAGRLCDYQDVRALTSRGVVLRMVEERS